MSSSSSHSFFSTSVPIKISTFSPPISSARAYFNRSKPAAESTQRAKESSLLKSIKAALRGHDTESISEVHEMSFHVGAAGYYPPASSSTNSTPSSQSFTPYDPTWGDVEELSWDAQTVILSVGGVMKKKWNFGDEEQSIQWATLGLLEQNASSTVTAQSSGHYASILHNSDGNFPTVVDEGGGGAGDHAGEGDGKRPTFGPFSQAQKPPQIDASPSVRIPAVFVFLRSIGKIFLRNGVEYTFSLPFIVRRAWPLRPHGVLIQRVLEPAEVAEAEMTGEPVLPTIFSMTSPFAEAAAVGLTAGIVGGFELETPSLMDEEEHLTSPLKSVEPTERVIWVSTHGPESKANITVTVNVKNKRLTVWRYAYMQPKDVPANPPKPRPPTAMAKRHSRVGSASGSIVTIQGARRASGMHNPSDRYVALSPGAKSPEHSPVVDFHKLPDFPPGVTAGLSTAATMAAIAGPKSVANKGRRNSLTRNELSATIDRLMFGAKYDDSFSIIEDGKMKASYWMEKVFSRDISEADTASWRDISISLFDHRFDGTSERSLLAICLPSSRTMQLYSIYLKQDKMLAVVDLRQIPAIAAAPVMATRKQVYDLLVLKADRSLSLFTHGLFEIPALPVPPPPQNLNPPRKVVGQPVSLLRGVKSSALLVYEGGLKIQAQIDLRPRDQLTQDTLELIALTLPTDMAFKLHHMFIVEWSSKGLIADPELEFECLSKSLYRLFGLEGTRSGSPPSLTTSHPATTHTPVNRSGSSWDKLPHSSSHRRFREDCVLNYLKLPGQGSSDTLETTATTIAASPSAPHPLLAPLLFALHHLGESLRLVVDRFESLIRLAPVICRIALQVRPEWADYWRRLVPDALPFWPTPATTVPEHLDDRIPLWPLDASAILFGRITSPEWVPPWHATHNVATRFGVSPSFAFGQEADPLHILHHLTALYRCLADPAVPQAQKRAENAVYLMVMSDSEMAAAAGVEGHAQSALAQELHRFRRQPTQVGTRLLDRLPIGIAAPLREAARTCQLAPPGDWPLVAYRAIGRNDLAASASDAPDLMYSDGYKTVKEFISPTKPRQSISDIITEAKAAANGDFDATSGVELNLKDFTDIRFGQDRRLEEVARMLCSSNVVTAKVPDRPELNEHDQAKEQQTQVMRMAERTLALPYGRALYTYGSVSTVTREAYAIPKLEYAVRLQPLNMVVAPETSKMPPDSLSWGAFHNGVAAGLRISPSSDGVESSWIAFNKPSDLTPEHAGFLYALGLTGHLRHMLTWHTLGYLTPKHDLTSIGVLLGLSAANVGSGNKHVTRLLAVHTPALLPTPSVDLNISLVTQAAGLAGVGLLYLGTKNRRMAEVCLNQISRKDLAQPDLSNEHREAYTYAAALAFGMIMLGKGSSIPADLALLSRLNVLIHGEAPGSFGQRGKPQFDLSLTSPAATIALGLMYLRTERQDVADMLTIPDTVLSLNRIQPSFLMLRTISRALIMWETVKPTNDWVQAQIPDTVREAMDNKVKYMTVPDDSLELAYYNIIAGCCFAVGLKYAGTASQEAYVLIIRFFDTFTRMVYSNGIAFEHKIKRSAVREGLNVISTALSMVMAGTGEITCFRRLRYAYGMYQQAMYTFKYGIYVTTHLSIGLLFLGGGRYTLGTSNAAIACLVTAFFPRSHQLSSDNKSYLQALRHLWVLAVEPRCLIARDVDTTEVVYLPVKITMKDDEKVGTTQLISPTLFPELDKLLSLRVDTPRYWPFYLDTQNLPRHREALLRSQTLYVKRRTAFLSYTEDPRGSRSLFVRSGSSTGEAAVLDFPQLKIDPSNSNSALTSLNNQQQQQHQNQHQSNRTGDLSDFITSFSNDVLFLAFADHLSREEGRPGDYTPDERMFHAYCHAALLDSILQDKPQTLQTHLTLFRYRMMEAEPGEYQRYNDSDHDPDRSFAGKGKGKQPEGTIQVGSRGEYLKRTRRSKYFHLRLQDLRFATEFYCRVYDRRFSGRTENNPRPPLIRESTVLGAQYALDRRLDRLRSGVTGGVSSSGMSKLLEALGYYARGEVLSPSSPSTPVSVTQETLWQLSWYLLRNSVPVSTVLIVLRQLSRDAHIQCYGKPAPDGTEDAATLELGIREVLHLTGTRMMQTLGAGWDVKSLDEVVRAWKNGTSASSAGTGADPETSGKSTVESAGGTKGQPDPPPVRTQVLPSAAAAPSGHKRASSRSKSARSARS